ncbi:hypothetical protein GCM10029992_33900 [Glycomyces albus]
MKSIIVVGAGPTGLLLAGDLAEAGLDVIVIEKRPAGLSNLSRAFGVHARTMEVLDMRGLAEQLLSYASYKMDKIAAFGNAELDLSNLPSAFSYLLVCSQTYIEQVLRDRLDDLGVAVHHDTEVTGLEQEADAVTLTAAGPGGRPSGSPPTTSSAATASAPPSATWSDCRSPAARSCAGSCSPTSN